MYLFRLVINGAGDWERKHKQGNHETKLMFKGELQPKIEEFLYRSFTLNINV